MKRLIILTCLCITSLIAHDKPQQENPQPEINQNIQRYQKLLANNPNNFHLLFQLGNEFFHDQQYNEAIIHYEKALRQNPQNMQTLFNIGLTLASYLGYLDEAKIYFKKMIEINPNQNKAHFNLGKIFEKQGNIDKAIAHYEQAATLGNDFPYIYPKIATLCHKKKYYQKSITYFKKSVELYPEKIDLRLYLGNVYNELGMVNDATLAYLKAYEIDNNSVTAIYNAGYSLKVRGDIDKAIILYKKALELKPDYEDAKYAIALAMLYKGDFKNGWKQYEFRLIKEKRNAENLRRYLRNNSLAGKTIHLAPEGGLGDTMQFIRYAQVLKEMGAHVSAYVQKPLIPLVSNCPYIDTIVGPGQKPKPYNDFASIMSLPAIFETTEETIPQNIPYLFPDKALEKKWKSYFANNTTFKIGLCWEADVKNDVSRLLCARRSIDLMELEKLSHIPNIEFYSLQKTQPSSSAKASEDRSPKATFILNSSKEHQGCKEQLCSLPPHFVVHTFGPDFDKSAGPFMDTAAIMNQLDLIITVDTSIAHLAGALGRPVWVMLPYNTDWRWIAGRTDSPWYPTMKIFKQPKAFDWKTVVQKIYNNLVEIVRQERKYVQN